jgi:hypothetical protein
MPGLDLVDGANNRRHGSLNGPLIAGGTIRWAPKGIEPGPVGKLSMGVGGINACVISKPFAE